MKKILLGFVLLLSFTLVACKNNGTTTTDEATTTKDSTPAGTTASTTEQLDPVDYSDSLKILAIGNSFSEDAFEHLWAIANDYGIDEVIIANLYIGGSSLQQHYGNMLSDAKVYQYQKNSTGILTRTDDYSILQGLKAEEWDIISVQQVSGQSGRPNSFDPYLNRLLDYIREHKTNPNARVYWHMTWAYQQDSDHGDFPLYRKNQESMYNAIVKAVKDRILTDTRIHGVVPVGTAIQNVRTSYLGDTLTRDGFHLTFDVGRYAAGLTWFKYVTGFNIDNIKYRPNSVSKDMQRMLFESVNNAVEKPYEVTESTYDVENPNLSDVSNHTLLRLKNVVGYWVSDLSHEINTTASNAKYFTTHEVRLSKDNLPVGTVLRIEEDYQYRINYFKTLEGSTEGNVRSENITEREIIIDEAWWGDFEYVSFNVSHIGGNIDITKTYKEVANKFEIYVTSDAILPTEGLKDDIVTFVSGFWDVGNTDIAPGVDAFSKGFAASNVLSKNDLKDFTHVTVYEKYEVRIVLFTKESNGKFKVAKRSEYINGKIAIDMAFWETYDYVGFNIRSIPSSDLSKEVDFLSDWLEFSFDEVYVHDNRPLSFVSGFWADDAKKISSPKDDNDTFTLGFGASNIRTKDSFDHYTEIKIAEGYQVSIVYLEYENREFTVKDCSDNLTGTIELNNDFWKDYEYIAFNISKVESKNLSNQLDLLTEKIMLLPVDIEHETKPLEFISGYWNGGFTEVTPGIDAFSRGFLASNVLKISDYPIGTEIVIASGYQIRVSFVRYSGETGYKVIERLENTTGTFVLTEELVRDYQYFVINLSAIPSKDMTSLIDTAPELLTFNVNVE